MLKNEWLIDIGSFTHICCEEKYFLELDKEKRPYLLQINDDVLQVQGGGSVLINVLNENQKRVEIVLNNCAY